MLREQLLKGEWEQLSYTLAPRNVEVEVELSVRARRQQVLARGQEAAKHYRQPSGAYPRNAQTSVGHTLRKLTLERTHLGMTGHLRLGSIMIFLGRGSSKVYRCD